MSYTPEEQAWISKLKSAQYGQQHLLPEGAKVEDVKRLLKDVMQADKAYPGGIICYIQRAKKLLEESKAGVNPFEGYTPVVPEGEKPIVGTAAFAELENIGTEHLHEMGFVLVAGGLGERLGYPGIKIGLPSETTTNTTYIELYIKHILAMQERASKARREHIRLPLAIMTSEDTHARTVELLEKNDYFGMPRCQLTIMKQEKVPALLDNDARFAVSATDAFQLETKPHGHGDVHTLLNQYGLTKKWLSEGKRYVLFFQDTNGLIFKALPVVLGVSVRNNFVMNSVTVPRKPGEAVGGICKLVKTDGSSLTINVEYNQLDPLLKSTGDKQGDVPDATGNSKFPGNINVLLFKLDRYAQLLEETNGTVPEFVNPKYKDATKTAFKSPTRLECMMQEFPRLLGTNDKVGFTELERWFCFSTVKNNVADASVKAKQGLAPEAAFSGESDAYNTNVRLLQKAAEAVGVVCDIAPAQSVSYLDIPYTLGPRVVLAPSFAVTLQEMKQRLWKKPIKISATSTLIIDGDVEIEGLELDGALILRAEPGAKIVVKNLKVKNDGWAFKALDEGALKAAPAETAIRGYVTERKDQMCVCAKSGVQVVGNVWCSSC